MTSIDRKNELASAMWAESKAEGFAEGRIEGFAEGHKFGRSEGLRQSILDLCEVLAVDLTAEREAALHGASDVELTSLRDHLKHERRWP